LMICTNGYQRNNKFVSCARRTGEQRGAKVGVLFAFAPARVSRA
jgi:hypothetical protein